MAHNKVQKIQCQKRGIKHPQSIDDFVAVEHPLEIRIGHTADQWHTLAVTLCTPNNIEQFITGYLLTEGIVSSNSEIKYTEIFDDEFSLVVEVKLSDSIDIESHLKTRQNMAHPSCGVCGRTGFDDLFKTSYPKIEPMATPINDDIILALPKTLNQHQNAFKKTGGLHASALFNTQGELLAVFEDVGRHNALDKLIGHCLQASMLPLSNHIILLSGRISFELVHKALKAGASTLAAIGAPSSLSIELAKQNQLNLIGFINDESFNIYQ